VAQRMSQSKNQAESDVLTQAHVMSLC
jgi:hypothetical protein